MHLGSFYDEESEKYCYLRRTYDPARGRFLQRFGFGYLCGPNLYSAWEGAPTSPFVEASGTKGTSIFARAALLFEGTWAGCAPPGRQGGVHFTVKPSTEDVLGKMDKEKKWPKDGPTGPGGTCGEGPVWGDPMPPGTAHPSGKPDVNCEVPAAALYAAFAAEGWDVTYTVIRRYEKVRIPGTNRYWYNEYAWHCLVDVHTKEGFKWFNGNKPGHNADGKPIGESTEPDKDGDGNPKTEDKPGSTPTEFSKDGETAVRTEVYKSPADAQKADALRFR